MNNERPWIGKAILNKTSSVGEISIPGSNFYYRSKLIETAQSQRQTGM